VNNNNNFWNLVASAMLKKKKKLSNIEFRSFFKLSYPLIEYVWRTLKDSFPQSKPKYLLWTLFFLKTTSTNFQEISSFVGTTYQTLRIHVTIVLKRLNKLLPEVQFVLQQCLLLILYHIFHEIIFTNILQLVVGY
jgi:hypothetical protein